MRINVTAKIAVVLAVVCGLPAAVLTVFVCVELSWLARQEAAITPAVLSSSRAALTATAVVVSLVCFAAGMMLLHNQIARPLRNLISGVQTFAEGNLSHRIRTHRWFNIEDELVDLAVELNNIPVALEEGRNQLEEKVTLRTRELADESTRANIARQELEKAMDRLRETQANLIQTEKLASLGLLVAGVAHEINNPLSFVLNNLSVVKRDYRMVLSILERYRKLRIDGLMPDEKTREIVEMEEEFDLDYVVNSGERIFSSTLNGLERVRTIIGDLKDFSRLDEQECDEINIERSLDTTLELVGFHLVSKGIHVVRRYACLPRLHCNSQRLNQVFLNLIMNAIQAMEKGGTLTLGTRISGDMVEVVIDDTGCGIQQENLSKIFDPFFTTKKQGEGTGLGLSVSYGIVKEHNGLISVTSTPGKGSEFVITLPLNDIGIPDEQQG